MYAISICTRLDGVVVLVVIFLVCCPVSMVVLAFEVVVLNDDHL